MAKILSPEVQGMLVGIVQRRRWILAGLGGAGLLWPGLLLFLAGLGHQAMAMDGMTGAFRAMHSLPVRRRSMGTAYWLIGVLVVPTLCIMLGLAQQNFARAVLGPEFGEWRGWAFALSGWWFSMGLVSLLWLSPVVLTLARHYRQYWITILIGALTGISAIAPGLVLSSLGPWKNIEITTLAWMALALCPAIPLGFLLRAQVIDATREWRQLWNPGPRAQKQRVGFWHWLYAPAQTPLVAGFLLLVWVVIVKLLSVAPLPVVRILEGMHAGKHHLPAAGLFIAGQMLFIFYIVSCGIFVAALFPAMRAIRSLPVTAERTGTTLWVVLWAFAIYPAMLCYAAAGSIGMNGGNLALAPLVMGAVLIWALPLELRYNHGQKTVMIIVGTLSVLAMVGMMQLFQLPLLKYGAWLLVLSTPVALSMLKTELRRGQEAYRPRPLNAMGQRG